MDDADDDEYDEDDAADDDDDDDGDDDDDDDDHDHDERKSQKRNCLYVKRLHWPIQTVSCSYSLPSLSVIVMLTQVDAAFCINETNKSGFVDVPYTHSDIN